MCMIIIRAKRFDVAISLRASKILEPFYYLRTVLGSFNMGLKMKEILGKSLQFSLLEHMVGIISFCVIKVGLLEKNSIEFFLRILR